MPQLCGPSGTAARRLALANQAGFSNNEKHVIGFVTYLYNVFVGAHTLDESCVIGINMGYSTYERGNYQSIFPSCIKNEPYFENLWHDIQILNSQYQHVVDTNKASQECKYDILGQ